MPFFFIYYAFSRFTKGHYLGQIQGHALSLKNTIPAFFLCAVSVRINSFITDILFSEV